jgi:broad specificity phosphatase PhoE
MSSSLNYCDVYYIRHAEAAKTAHSIGGQPKNDKGLSDKGVAYSKQLTALFQENQIPQFDAIYTSQYPRSTATVEFYAQEKNLIPQQHPGLGEKDHGSASIGKNSKLKNYKALSRLEKMVSQEAPNAETGCEVIDRLFNATLEIASRHLEERVLCCSHDLAMRAFFYAQQLASITNSNFGKIQATEVVTRLIKDKNDTIINEVEKISNLEMIHLKVDLKSRTITVVGDRILLLRNLSQ